MFKLFYLFMVYAILGWLMEVVIVSIHKKSLSARGFLVGPWCPIYGFGAVFITLFLKKYNDDLWALFVNSFLLGSILEYFTSYIMEKIFKARWWDYSDHKYNLNGRISLTTSLGFGVLGVIVVKIFNPFFMKLPNSMPLIVFNIVMILMFIVFLSDVVFSYIVISRIKKVSKNQKDITEISTEELKKALKNKSYFNRRLLNSFPNLKFNIKNLQNNDIMK